MAFRVGQKVVCVDDSPAKNGVYSGPLIMGAIYTVKWAGKRPSDHMPVLILEEIRGAFHWSGCEYAYRQRRFRPVAERSTDISIFTAMLNPSKEHVRA